MKEGGGSVDLQTLAAIVGILSGLITLVGSAASALERFRKPAPAQVPRIPVQVGAYLYPPPASNASGPYPSYPQPGTVPPPQDYGWPATPPPEPAWQPGAPVPQPGYAAPPNQRGNVHQLHSGAPYAMPQPARKRWFTHPTIAVYAAIALVASGLIGMLSGSNSGSTSVPSMPPALSDLVTFLTLIVIAAYVVSLVLAVRQIIRLRRWGWLAVVIVFVAYGALAFGIFGPSTPPQPKTPAYPAYPPPRM